MVFGIRNRSNLEGGPLKTWSFLSYTLMLTLACYLIPWFGIFLVVLVVLTFLLAWLLAARVSQSCGRYSTSKGRRGQKPQEGQPLPAGSDSENPGTEKAHRVSGCRAGKRVSSSYAESRYGDVNWEGRPVSLTTRPPGWFLC